MTAGDRLILLKQNLQMITDSNDEFLIHLISAGEAAMTREGIRDDGSIDYDACIIDYAAYLFRKRGASTAGGKDGETAMPRFLRWQMNNLLLSQKIRSGME